MSYYQYSEDVTINNFYHQNKPGIPQVGVVLTVRDSLEETKKSIQSVLNQGNHLWRLYVVQFGFLNPKSIFGTAALDNTSDHEVLFTAMASLGSHAEARDHGLGYAKEPIITYLTEGDTMDKGRINDLVHGASASSWTLDVTYINSNNNCVYPVNMSTNEWTAANISHTNLPDIRWQRQDKVAFLKFLKTFDYEDLHLDNPIAFGRKKDEQGELAPHGGKLLHLSLSGQVFQDRTACIRDLH